MLYVICTPLRPGHLSVRVGDILRRSKEIVKKSRIAPFNAIVVVVIIIMTMIMMMIISSSSSSCCSFYTWIQENVFPPIWIDSAFVGFVLRRKQTSLASVFSSFSLSMLLTIQVSKRKQNAKSGAKHWNSEGWDALCSCVSSANFW